MVVPNVKEIYESYFYILTWPNLLYMRAVL